MKLSQPSALVFVPRDGDSAEQALARTTHLGIGAHPDDLEFMAQSGILQCYDQPDQWFCGLIVTDGGGSPRASAYAEYSDEDMRAVRREEQQRAAQIGKYSAVVCLDYRSSDVRVPHPRKLIDDIRSVLEQTRPNCVYTHNLADRHDTHVAVALATIAALRELPPEGRPTAVYGCEVWRSLDWMLDRDKVAFDVSGHEELLLSLMRVYDSQIGGGKRYDQATVGRRKANATYGGSHVTDTADMVEYAMDLTPLVRDQNLDVARFVEGYLERFSADVVGRLRRFW